MTDLVILPGLDGTATLHDGFVASASASFESVTVIAYAARKALGYAELEALVREQLPTTAPFVLLGESFSGPIAIAIAARPPPNLVGLVLSTTFAQSPFPLLSPLTRLIRSAPVGGLPLPLLSWLLLGRWASGGMEASLKGALMMVSPDVLRFRAAETLGVDVSASLPSIAVPVLYLGASHDRLVSATSANRIQSAVPRCTTLLIAGPHLLLQAAPAACADAVAAFSKSLGH